MQAIIYLVLTGVFIFFTFRNMLKYSRDPQVGSLVAAAGSGLAMIVVLIIAKSIFCWLAVILSFMGYGFYNYRVKRSQWGRTMSLFCSGLVIFLASSSLVYEAFGCERRKQGREAAQLHAALNEAKNRVIGEFLAQKFAGNRLLAVYWDYDNAAQDNLAALRQGLDGKLEITTAEMTFSDDAFSGNPESVVSADQYPRDQLYKIMTENRGCRLVILYVGMPDDMPGSPSAPSFWQVAPDQAPILVLPDEFIEVLYANKIQEGRVACMVVNRKDTREAEGDLPQHRKTFREHFTLAHQGNAAEILNQENAN